MPPSGREFRVGLVILLALGVLAAGVFLIGEKNNLFSRKNRYFTEFTSVSGLKPGSPVQLNGVDVGTVERVVLPSDATREQIQVWISVDREYAERIRGPLQTGQRTAAEPSQARIKTLGLLGDKFIEINSGAPEYPVIPTNGKIPAAQPTNVDALLASGEDVMDNVVEISHSLSMILGRMERGEGLLGQITTNSPEGQRLKNSLIGTSESLERIASTVETGSGPLPRLLNDRAMGEQLATSLDRFESLLAKAETGPGLLPGLLNDPAMKTQADETLATLNQVARDLHGFTADLETSDALVPRLVKDEEYGREITQELQGIVNRLSSVAAKLDQGEGTAAKLINDPQIYEAVNDIIIGVNESRMLRWLIRNRQNAGIKKRYEETQQATGQTGTTEETEEGTEKPADDPMGTTTDVTEPPAPPPTTPPPASPPMGT
ncbi:MAG TPA: MlaD family protein [Thermoanaerobaculia bacterium]|nr:MlaD family protein [Thermoanaerobaculia bacterium]